MLTLTERTIREAKPDGRTRILWDGSVTGFGVKVSAGGSKRYVIDYRTGGRQRRATIGRVAELSLRDARKLAASELARIRGGEHDPLETRREQRDALTVRAGLPSRPPDKLAVRPPGRFRTVEHDPEASTASGCRRPASLRGANRKLLPVV